MGNVLRLARTGDDVIHRWTDDPLLQRYEIWSSTAKDGTGAVLVGGALLGQEMVFEPGIVPDGSSYFYQVVGLDCSQGSGPP